MYKNLSSWQDVAALDTRCLDAACSKAVVEYTKIPKFDLITRRDLLQNILLAHPDALSEGLTRALRARVEYFNQLLSLYEQGVLYADKDPRVYNKAVVISRITPQCTVGKLKYPNDKVFYSDGSGGVWGDAYLDILDPAHRNLMFWNQVWLESGSRLPFFTALEEYIMPPDIKHIYFYKDNIIQSKKTIISNGCLLQEGMLVNSPDVVDDSNQTLFIIDAHNDLMLDFSSKHVRHISLSCGRPVRGGGLMVVKNGYIQEISNSSGHYLFNTDDLVQTISLLMQKGLKISDNVIVDHWYSFGQHERLSFADFYGKYKLVR